MCAGAISTQTPDAPPPTASSFERTAAELAEAESSTSREAAQRLLEKLRVFVIEQLDEEEGALFAALVAPGVALAYREDEVTGFGVDWRPRALPDALAQVVRDGGVRVDGLWR